MISSANIILQELGEPLISGDYSTDHLQQLADTYPYYGPAQFLLAKKLYAHGEDPGKPGGLQKAAIHFNNKLWLHFLLNKAAEEKTEKNEFSSSKIEIIVEKEKPGISNNGTDEVISDKLNSLLQEQAAEFEKPVEVSMEIPIESTPYHRIDYFDSQGIRLEEEKVNDKLATKLKKFTEWLKQMKSINPNPVNLGSDEAGEHIVQDIAEHSNDKEEIVTETMAEVLVKQGKPEQAIEIYQKLSFIYPSKSVYFAAKIEDLKVKK